MKKSIIYLGVALVAFANVSMASSQSSFEKNNLEFSKPYITPLHIAISKGDFEVVKKFVEYGANVNERTEDMTPLMAAARYNRVDIIKYLLANGARPGDKTEKGFTALKYAELSNATEAIALLKDLK